MGFGSDVLKQALGMVLGSMLTIGLVMLTIYGVIWFFSTHVEPGDIVRWLFN